MSLLSIDKIWGELYNLYWVIFMINYTTNLIAGRDFGVAFEPNLGNCPIHSHSYIEIAYTVSGEAIHSLNGVKSPLNAGDYVIINPGDIHGYQVTSKEPYVVINCILNARFLYSSAKENNFKNCLMNPMLNFNTSSLSDLNESLVFTNPEPYMRTLFETLMYEYNKKSYKYRTICRNLLNIILLNSARKLTQVSQSTFQLTEYMKDYISIHYAEDNLLQKMGKEVNYSPSYMSTKFKAETGMTFKKFLQSIRIDASISLLHETKMSIAEIASAVGYKDIKHFYSTFKKITHTTPSQHRPRYSSESK